MEPILSPKQEKEVARLDKLFRIHLTKKKHFQLFLIEYNDAQIRDSLIQRFNQKLPKNTILKMNFSHFPDFASLEIRVEELSQKGIDLIHLVNLENWLFSDPNQNMAHGFNLHRENFFNRCSSMLFLWMTQSDVKQFALQAADMWAKRALVLDLLIPDSTQKITSDFVRGLSPRERSERIKRIHVYFEKNGPPNLNKTAHLDLLIDLAELYQSLNRKEEGKKYAQQVLSSPKIPEDLYKRATVPFLL